MCIYIFILLCVRVSFVYILYARLFSLSLFRFFFSRLLLMNINDQIDPLCGKFRVRCEYTLDNAPRKRAAKGYNGAY